MQSKSDNETDTFLACMKIEIENVKIYFENYTFQIFII